MTRTAALACPLCASTGHVLHDGVRDQLFGVPGRWDLGRCTNPTCRLVWLDTALDAETIISFYGSYYTHHGDEVDTGEEPEPLDAAPAGPLERWRAAVGRWWPTPARRRKIDRLEHLLLPRGDGRKLLEVGCGAGKNLARLQARGWDVTGQDLDPEAAATAERLLGVPVVSGELGEAGLPPASFDALVMIHVLEHLQEPDRDLAVCARLLVPGGTLVCITPNADALGHTLFGRHWRGLEPPRHLRLYNPTNAARLVEAAGFVDVRTCSTSARADRITHDTLDVALRRLPHRVRFVMSRLGGVAAEILATVTQADRRGCGEECVVVASTPQATP